MISKRNIAYVNGVSHTFEDGENVLSFLKRINGKNSVPTLCDAPQLEAFGSCRVCSIEMSFTKDGPKKVVASCHTPLVDGAHIFPETKKIQRLRKNIVELVLTDHPLDCLTCEVNGNCELQDVAAQVGIREQRYPAGKNHLDRKKDLSHPYMTSDLSKCINCYRCVRACDEVQGEFVLSMFGRGFDSRIIKSMDTTFEDSSCVSCGACSQACPTSAISDVFFSKGIEATKKVKTICTYCGVGCNLEVNVKNDEILSIRAPEDSEVNPSHTCLKGRYAFKFYKHPDRLRTPLIRRNGKLKPASWDEAYDYIADKLKTLGENFGPDSIAGISSARCTNEENYLMQKFIRVVVGTNNIDCCARVCHAPTALGMQKSFGTGAATNSIKDLKETDLVLIVGANPTQGHPVTGAKIKQEIMKGKTLIIIDPRKIELSPFAQHHLQLRPGTNVAVLNMMAYYIIEANLQDQAFIDERCENFDLFINEIKALDMDEQEAICGVDKKEVRAAALAYAKASKAMEFHGLGVTEHSQGSKTVMLLANLAMLTGNIGKPGVGINPLRGQNNVQGAADMGVQPHQGAGYFDVTTSESQAYYKVHYGVDMPENIGFKIPEMFEAAVEKKLKALWIIGEDVVQTDPNSNFVKKAMESLELLVVQELFETETSKYAHVVLPASSFFEKSGTFTNSERRIQRVNNVVEPLSGTKPDGEIIVDIMNRMGFEQKPYKPDTMLEEISQVVPFFKGVVWDELGDMGKQWPVLEGGQDTKIIHVDSFKRGKGKFQFFNWKESQELVDNKEEYPYVLTTGRLLEHYNCGTMTRRTSNLKIKDEDILMINPKDANDKGISEEDQVKLFSARGEVILNIHITDEVKPGVLYTTFHFPELMINQITSNTHDEESMCPEYKVTSVGFEKVIL
ncbi:MAG: formate dehydrogenase subunit alpha [Planctomycetota bacterium]|nr:MAG: formate dehydrogenase subunit alpha [Planctomycetota bacterium]